MYVMHVMPVVYVQMYLCLSAFTHVCMLCYVDVMECNVAQCNVM